jgi:organic radical activating enzyme
VRDSTTLTVSELFESIQGEGPSAGVPCTFLRLSHCNLRCSWCDTKYTWDWQAYRIEDETRVVALDAVARELARFGRERLVVTGGEPLIQQRALAGLFTVLPASWAIEVETNGTLEPLPELVERVMQWNVSPKLSNSGETLARRYRPEALGALRATGRAFLKLVVATPEDVAEAEGLVSTLAWPAERVLLMPQGATRAELAATTAFVRAAAAERGFGHSPRLHIERWEGVRGK